MIEIPLGGGGMVINRAVKPASDSDAHHRMLAAVPGPRRSPWRQALDFGSDQYSFLQRGWRQWGDIFSFRIPGEPPRLIVAAPQEIKKVFALKPEDYFSGDPSMHVNFGESCILLNDGERHRRDRQLLTPPLHGEMLKSYGRLMLDAVNQAIDGWRRGQALRLHDALAEVTLHIITRCILGAVDTERELGLRALVREWLEVTLSPAMFTIGSLVGLNRMRRYLERQTNTQLRAGLAARLPALGRRSARLKARFMTMLIDDIERCRRDGAAGRTDVLALVAEARYEDGERMDVRTVVDQLTLLLAAGHETTAKSVCWAMLDVLGRPDVHARLRDELQAAFGPSGAIVPERCAELPYLNAVIKESMRLKPVTTVLQREITRPIELGGYHIPAGVVVAPSNYLAQRHPSVWEAADEFRPERFLDGRHPAPYEYFPFGGGRRRCLGVAFASFEMPILLAALLWRTELRLVDGSDRSPRFSGVTIGPADGLRVIVD
jgi:cytochrome P450